MVKEFIEQKLLNGTDQQPPCPPRPKARSPAHHWRGGVGECGWSVKHLQIRNFSVVVVGGVGSDVSAVHTPSVPIPLFLVVKGSCACVSINWLVFSLFFTCRHSQTSLDSGWGVTETKLKLPWAKRGVCLIRHSNQEVVGRSWPQGSLRVRKCCQLPAPDLFSLFIFQLDSTGLLILCNCTAGFYAEEVGVGKPTVGKGGNGHRYCQAVSSRHLQKKETASPFRCPTLSQGTTVRVLALVLCPCLGQSLWSEEWDILPS